MCALPHGRRRVPTAFWRLKQHTTINRGIIMGKYVLGWILGVPAVVLVVIYLIMN
jgi:hypothetical protein